MIYAQFFLGVHMNRRSLQTMTIALVVSICACCVTVYAQTTDVRTRTEPYHDADTPSTTKYDDTQTNRRDIRYNTNGNSVNNSSPLTNTNSPNATRRTVDVNPAEDRDILQKIYVAIDADSDLSPNLRTIQVSSMGGAVTITGSVATESQKNSIEQKIKQVDGVRDVKNQLQVSGNESALNSNNNPNGVNYKRNPSY